MGQFMLRYRSVSSPEFMLESKREGRKGGKGKEGGWEGRGGRERDRDRQTERYR